MAIFGSISFITFDAPYKNPVNMKNFRIIFLFLALIPFYAAGQVDPYRTDSIAAVPSDSVKADSVPKKRPNYIKSGFYLKLGPCIPVGNYAKVQIVPFDAIGTGGEVVKSISYLPAELGASLEVGYLVYLGPSFANNYMRAGIDFAFMNLWFNSTSPPTQKNLIEKYYTFVGQKIGPLFTINPVDRFMIDLSYKLNATLGYHDELDGYAPLLDSQTSEYGVAFLFHEVSIGFRYTLATLSLQYNWGRMNYNNSQSENPSQEIKVKTVRVMLGLQF